MPCSYVQDMGGAGGGAAVVVTSSATAVTAVTLSPGNHVVELPGDVGHAVPSRTNVSRATSDEVVTTQYLVSKKTTNEDRMGMRVRIRM